MRFATRAVHAGHSTDDPFHALSTPIYQTATFGWQDFDAEADPMYTRYGNPTRTATEKTLSAIEGAADALHLSSGMAAIATACSILRPGDHVLCTRDVYGGTHKLFSNYITEYGIEVTYADACDIETFASEIRRTTRLVWLESPTNPTIRVVDVRACAKLAKDAGATVVVDNTFATPVLQNPLELGCDVVMHSATKYLNGHSDIVGGALMWNDPAFGVFREYAKAVGNTPSPFDSWLLKRGICTLELRILRQSASALAIAEYLHGHQAIERVHYPGLSSDPGHELARLQMKGFGGMLAFVVRGGVESARRVANGLRTIKVAASLGGVESIIGYPPSMSHAMLSEQERRERGIASGLLRLSVGVEDPQDLIEDIEQALNKIQ
jgi:cystathionine beta-lyase/cystathionine gamma-synthase